MTLHTVPLSQCANRQEGTVMGPGKIHVKHGPVMCLCSLVLVYLIMVYRGWVRGKEKKIQTAWEDSPIWQEDEKSHKYTIHLCDDSITNQYFLGILIISITFSTQETQCVVMRM